MGKKFYIIILFLFSNINCSILSWARYIESDDDTDWSTGIGHEVTRDSDFEQKSYYYKKEGISINIQPDARLFALTMGPAYLPIIPVFQFYLIFDFFSPRNNFLYEVEGSILTDNIDYNIDVKQINASILGRGNSTYILLYEVRKTVGIDSSKIIYWLPINYTDSSNHVFQLSKVPFNFKIIFNTQESHFDSILISIKGISNKNINVNLPDLILIRKGKFHFDELTGGV
jgi:hypothetical protein